MYIIRYFLIILVVTLFACRESVLEFEENINISGKIYVSSAPEGAEIHWNNWNMHKSTPDSLTGVYPGIHEILLKQQGYRDTTIIVYMQEGNVEYINATLTSVLAILQE